MGIRLVAYSDRPTVYFCPAPPPIYFKPERWWGEEGKQLQPYFVTFSAGARGCIGRTISYLEQIVCCTPILHGFALTKVGAEASCALSASAREDAN